MDDPWVGAAGSRQARTRGRHRTRVTRELHKKGQRPPISSAPKIVSLREIVREYQVYESDDVPVRCAG